MSDANHKYESLHSGLRDPTQSFEEYRERCCFSQSVGPCTVCWSGPKFYHSSRQITFAQVADQRSYHRTLLMRIHSKGVAEI